MTRIQACISAPSALSAVKRAEASFPVDVDADRSSHLWSSEHLLTADATDDTDDSGVHIRATRVIRG